MASGPERGIGLSSMGRIDTAMSGPALAGGRLDVKTLRLAVHGWWLRNPLVYKPGVADLWAVARELASAGLPSGALVLDDLSGVRAEVTQTVLIVRPAAAASLLGMATACAVAEVAQSALGRACVVRWPWDVGISAALPHQRVCHISVEVDEVAEVAYIGLRMAFGRLRAARRTTSVTDEQPASPLAGRADWREVVLARTLHTLDVRLRAALSAGHEVERETLRQEWLRRLMIPRRARVFHLDGRRVAGMATWAAHDDALYVRREDGMEWRIPPEAVSAACGAGWTPASAPPARVPPHR